MSTFPTPASPLFATGQLPLICDCLDAQCPEMGVITPAPTYTLINGYFYNRRDYRVGLGALLLPLNYWRAARKGARNWRKRVLPDQLAVLGAAFLALTCRMPASLNCCGTFGTCFRSTPSVGITHPGFANLRSDRAIVPPPI